MQNRGVTAVMPDIVGTRWFEDLRQHISPTGEAASLLSQAEILCDKDVAVRLSNEISRVERDWLGKG